MKKGLLVTIIGITIFGITYFGLEMFEFAKGVKNDTIIPKKETIKLTVSKTESEPHEDNCIFDLTTQTDDFLKTIPEFSNYIWNNEQKKATIKLENGNTLIVTRGGCYHFSFYGNLFLSKSELNLNDESEIFKRTLWIADKLFHESDFKLIKELLKNKAYNIEKSKNQFYLTFDQEYYCNMTLVAKQLIDQDLISIEIGFYQC